LIQADNHFLIQSRYPFFDTSSLSYAAERNNFNKGELQKWILEQIRVDL
jgi:hypothetical protein